MNPGSVAVSNSSLGQARLCEEKVEEGFAHNVCCSYSHRRWGSMIVWGRMSGTVMDNWMLWKYGVKPIPKSAETSNTAFRWRTLCMEMSKNVAFNVATCLVLATQQ